MSLLLRFGRFAASLATRRLLRALGRAVDCRVAGGALQLLWVLVLVVSIMEKLLKGCVSLPRTRAVIFIFIVDISSCISFVFVWAPLRSAISFCGHWEWHGRK